MVQTGFAVTAGKGVHIAFANGYKVSVQWGPGNYCDHHHAPFDRMRTEACGAEGSTTAEVAVFDPRGEFVQPDIPEWDSGDDVCGWRTPEQVLAIQQWAAAQ